MWKHKTERANIILTNSIIWKLNHRNTKIYLTFFKSSGSLFSHGGLIKSFFKYIYKCFIQRQINKSDNKNGLLTFICSIFPTWWIVLKLFLSSKYLQSKSTSVVLQYIFNALSIYGTFGLKVIIKFNISFMLTWDRTVPSFKAVFKRYVEPISLSGCLSYLKPILETTCLLL